MADRTILARFNVEEAEQRFLEDVRSENREDEWVELLTEWRENRVVELLTEFLGPEWRTKEVVLRWEQRNGRWVKAESMLAAEWCRQTIESRGSRLAGLASVQASLKKKIALKKRRAAKA